MTKKDGRGRDEETELSSKNAVDQLLPCFVKLSTPFYPVVAQHPPSAHRVAAVAIAQLVLLSRMDLENPKTTTATAESVTSSALTTRTGDPTKGTACC